MTARGGQDDAPSPAPRDDLAKLRSLAVGAALHSKGARAFVIEIVPHGIIITATDRSLIRTLTVNRLIRFEEVGDAHPEWIKAILRQLDAVIDRELAASQ